MRQNLGSHIIFEPKRRLIYIYIYRERIQIDFIQGIKVEYLGNVHQLCGIF